MVVSIFNWISKNSSCFGQINEFRRSQDDESSESPLSVEEVAIGFIKVANEAMCRPIRALTQAKGYDTAKHILSCFGGAGGQHACAIAASLGMSKIFIHKCVNIYVSLYRALFHTPVFFSFLLLASPSDSKGI